MSSSVPTSVPAPLTRLRRSRFLRRASLASLGGIALLLVGWLFLGLGAGHASAAPTSDILNLSIGASPGSTNLSMPLQILVMFTVLSIAPGLVIMTTCFVRIIIVLSFLRNALTLQTPPNQVLLALAMFLTFFIMQPTWKRVVDEAITPMRDNKITFEQGIDKAEAPLKTFMLKYAGEGDLRLFISMSPTPIELTTPDALPIQVVIPAFMLSEMKRGFEMGLMILLPFLVIDMVVASILMALGMMMLPPPTVSLPVKLMVFVLVDGWTLLIKSIVDSFKVPS